MRCFKGGAVALGVLLAGAAAAQGTLEGRIITALNAARADPGGYAQSLTGFRRQFRARIYALPGRTERVLTEEGPAAVDDAIGFLARQPRRSALAAGTVLAEAAADHVADQGSSGYIGHADRDGAGPSERVQRRGGGDQVTEVITYGASDAADVVRQLIVDDGVPARDHRAILFDPRLHYAGVSCGNHPTFRTMCVIDLAMTSDGGEDDVAQRSTGTRNGR